MYTIIRAGNSLRKYLANSIPFISPSSISKNKISGSFFRQNETNSLAELKVSITPSEFSSKFAKMYSFIFWQYLCSSSQTNILIFHHKYL